MRSEFPGGSGGAVNTGAGVLVGAGVGVDAAVGVAPEPEDGAGEPTGAGDWSTSTQRLTVPPTVPTGRAFPYEPARPSSRPASVTPLGKPSVVVPQPIALKVTSRKSASPAGTEPGGRKAAATPTSEPVLLAAAIAASLAPVKTEALA